MRATSSPVLAIGRVEAGSAPPVRWPVSVPHVRGTLMDRPSRVLALAAAARWAIERVRRPHQSAAPRPEPAARRRLGRAAEPRPGRLRRAAARHQNRRRTAVESPPARPCRRPEAQSLTLRPAARVRACLTPSDRNTRQARTGPDGRAPPLGSGHSVAIECFHASGKSSRVSGRTCSPASERAVSKVSEGLIGGGVLT